MHIVFGGSFNPPTKAHLDAYHHIKQSLAAERFIFLPVGQSYGKPLGVSDAHRRAMLELMCAPLLDADVSTIEMDAAVYEGTCVSLERLKSMTGGEMAFVIGADHLENLPHWRNANRLLEQFTIIVLNRNRTDLETVVKKNPWLFERRHALVLLQDYDYPASSSAFRRHRDFALLPDAVAEYVKRHDLYKG